MAENKTKPNDASVEDFLNRIDDDRRRQDCFAILKLMKQVTRQEPKMWGDSIVGFGTYHYKYESGREGDFFLTGFSPRKQNLTIYIMGGFDSYPQLTSKLGKYKNSKSCLYVNRLADIDLPTLKELIKQSVALVSKTWK